MSRTARRKASAREVQKSRGNWYAYHYEMRQLALALPPEKVKSALFICGEIAPPQMTVYGGVPESYPERTAYDLANRFELDVNLINPWYLSEAGWDDFQVKFQALPEPVDIYESYPQPACVQIGELYTLSTMEACSEPGFPHVN